MVLAWIVVIAIAIVSATAEMVIAMMSDIAIVLVNVIEVVSGAQRYLICSKYFSGSGVVNAGDAPIYSDGCNFTFNRKLQNVIAIAPQFSSPPKDERWPERYMPKAVTMTCPLIKDSIHHPLFCE